MELKDADPRSIVSAIAWGMLELPDGLVSEVSHPRWFMLKTISDFAKSHGCRFELSSKGIDGCWSVSRHGFFYEPNLTIQQACALLLQQE
jgi:hypothetical protein